MCRESFAEACMKRSETGEWVTPAYFENYMVLPEKEDNGKKTAGAAELQCAVKTGKITSYLN